MSLLSHDSSVLYGSSKLKGIWKITISKEVVACLTSARTDRVKLENPDLLPPVRQIVFLQVLATIL